MMSNKSFDQLQHGYVNNQLTSEELARFLELIQQDEYAEKLQEFIEQLLVSGSLESQADQDRAGNIFRNIINQAGNEEIARQGSIISLKQKSTRFAFLRLAAAAAFIGVILLGAYLWFNKDRKKELVKTERKNPYKNDLPPGGDKALLTLADGSVIVLDDKQNGPLGQQGNTKLVKLNGKINYNAAGTASNQVFYNTISTPRGGQFQIALPDGSQVWLNAASSLRFPTSFTGKERRVEISGQAYFEIARNESMPFIVKVHQAEVQVIGTRFDVMAYDDEGSVKTTLLEGAVKFVNNERTNILEPGQQTQLLKNGEVKLVKGVDLDNVVAWKKGIFHFQGDDIRTVLRQLSRWYEVDVVYTKKVDELFYAEIPRNTKLSDVLRVLELTGKVHFEIEGKKIMVTP